MIDQRKYDTNFRPGNVEKVVEAVKTLNYTDAIKVLEVAKEQIGKEWIRDTSPKPKTKKWDI